MPASADYPLGWPPEDAIFPIADAELVVLAGEHPFHAAEKGAAARNWRDEIAANPALYDGSMVFFSRMALEGGRMRGQGHMVPFSTFMWWRKKPRQDGVHLFAWAIPVSRDGAVIAIRMGRHTANPGQVYCAAGSLDASDVVDGRCDIAGNMRREVLEETGLDLAAAEPLSGYHALHRHRRITVFRFFRFDLSAEEMLERIAAHMLVDEEKEIDGAVAIRSADAGAHAYNAMMLPILRLFFDEGLPDEKPVAPG